MQFLRTILTIVKYHLLMLFYRLKDTDLKELVASTYAPDKTCPDCGVSVQRIRGRVVYKQGEYHIQARKFPRGSGVIVDEFVPGTCDWREVYRSGRRVSGKRFAQVMHLGKTCGAYGK